ncbi:MAG: riboflavin biosynthesis protein RibF [Clostridia bacterium]|nr:riboflavin biosynthesis protein RibF [Clostridia bacterium]
MLKTVYLTDNFKENAPCVMLLGGFDGAHLGHRALISHAKAYGLPVGIMSIVGGKGREIFTIEERREIFKDVGVDFAFELPFDEIRSLSPEVFSGILTERFAVKAFLCGEDFRYGYMASGTPETLKRDTRVRVETVELVKRQGEKVSASTIKTLLLEGEVEKANALLDSEFFLLGKVVKDRGVGRTIGFPTANIAYPQEKLPLKQGVYETVAEVDGAFYQGVTNYGARPTFSNENVTTETYLDGFSGDLYGKTMKIKFKRFLRGIEKFASAEDLKAQLTEDIRRVREND